MEKNVGSADRTIRIVAGLIIIIIGIYFKSWWGVIGVLPIITAALGWCPAYLPFGRTIRVQIFS
jgi:type IV secretory pathway TrbD component